MAIAFVLIGLAAILPSIVLLAVLRAIVFRFTRDEDRNWIAVAIFFAIVAFPVLIFGGLHPDWFGGILGDQPEDMPLDWTAWTFIYCSFASAIAFAWLALRGAAVAFDGALNAIRGS